jgi:superfamily II DNA helicase RecQ
VVLRFLPLRLEQVIAVYLATVVVVPYQALIEDLVDRNRKSGVECIEWKHRESNPAAVVVVSADIAGDVMSNGNFISYAGLLNEKGVLRRVVLDECHLIFTPSDWRPKLALLRNLRLLTIIPRGINLNVTLWRYDRMEGTGVSV